MPDSKNKISFADLDGFLKVAPIIGLFVLGYLQTLFPSKVEFEKDYTAPKLATYSDLQDLLLLDPIHDVDETGWPAAAS